MKKIFIIIGIIFISLFSGCTFYDTVVDTPNVNYSNITVKNDLYGVPDTFTKDTANEEKWFIQKGSTNYLRVRPAIFNEHAESSRSIKAIVNSTTSVGQIFRASEDNINGIYLTLETNGVTTFDNFETYNTGVELNNVWIDQLGYVPAVLETSKVYEGDKSMKLDGGYSGGEWIKTITPTDYTGKIGTFQAFFTKQYSTLKFEVFIGDGTNTKSAAIAHNAINTWIEFQIDESAMSEDGAGTTDTTAITQVGFRVVQTDWNDFMYVDNIEVGAVGGEVGIELWDMGSTMPINGTTTLLDGTQYHQIGDITRTTPVSQLELDLIGGKRLYHIHEFVAGVAQEIFWNEILNKDNYYAIVLNYIDTEVDVYGTTGFSDYYNSGYSFTVQGNSTPFIQTGAMDDLMFTIFSTQDVYVTESRAYANALPGEDANFMSSVEDNNMITNDIIAVHGVYVPQFGEIDFTDRPKFLPKGGKFNLDYNDDPTDNVETIVFGIKYVYEPPDIWG